MTGHRASCDRFTPARTRAIVPPMAEIAFLRVQFEQLRRDQAAERERFDVIHREALQRIEALTTGPLRGPNGPNDEDDEREVGPNGPDADTGHDAADDVQDRPGATDAP